MADGTLCSLVTLTAWIPLTDTGPETGGLELAIGKRHAQLPRVQDSGAFVSPESLTPWPPKRPRRAGWLLMDRDLPHRPRPTKRAENAGAWSSR
ncbi:MAG: hypothetical protein ABL956_16605 [Hyphomonadaceae bacterium]